LVTGAALAQPAEPSGLDIGKRVLKFLRVLEPSRKFTIKATDKGTFAWTVKYEVASGPDKKAERSAYVTLDGRYLTNQVIDIRQRTDTLREALRVGRCMRDKKVRVYVDPAQKESREQVAALGVVGRYVLIDCGGERKELCKRRGHEIFPVTVHPKGSDVGVRRLDWFTLKTECR